MDTAQPVFKDDGATPPVVPDRPELRNEFDEEHPQRVPGSFLEALPQFFVFPLILVATLTVVYLGLRWLAGTEPDSARELIDDLRRAGPHSRWQVAQQLADGLQRGRLTLDEVPTAELAGLYTGMVPESLEGFDEAVRRDVIRTQQFLLNALAYKADPALTELAVGELDNPDADVRMAALFALSRMGDPAAVPPLAEHLHSPVPEERWLTLGALGKIGTPDAMDAVAGLLGGDDTIDHRNAVLALAANGDVRAREPLVAMLDRESYAHDPGLTHEDYAGSDPATQAAARANTVDQFLVNAARAAASLGDPSLIPSLKNLSENDPSVAVQSAALSALHDLGAAPEND